MTRERPTVFIVTLEPTVPGVDSIRALRATLKFALNRFGLRCVDAREVADDPVRPSPALLEIDPR